MIAAIQRRSSVLLALLLVLVAIPAAGQETSAELYGQFRYSYNRADAGDSMYWASANNASRIGARGEARAGDWTAFFDLQVGVSIDAESSGQTFTQRYYTAGFRGPIGTLSVGRHSPAYKLPGLRVDPFYDTSTLSVGAGVPTTGVFGGASFGLSSFNNGWADRAIAYTSPELNGFVANAALYLDTESDPDYGLGLTYRWSDLELGVQYHDINSDGRNWAGSDLLDSAIRGHALYAKENWSVGGSYERVELWTGDHQNFFFLSGTFDPVPQVRLAGAVGHLPDDDVYPTSGTGVHGGIFVTPIQDVTVHLLYSYAGLDHFNDRGNLALGLTYAFAIPAR